MTLRYEAAKRDSERAEDFTIEAVLEEMETDNGDPTS
jgi:hypothetical protein